MEYEWKQNDINVYQYPHSKRNKKKYIKNTTHNTQNDDKTLHISTI